ncbi:MAG TPA: DUF992 domain-containing protein [Caulobacteraceae bacterium]
MKTLLMCAVAAGALAVSVPALAQDSGHVKVGTLSCHEASGWGFVFGSSRAIRCIYSNGSDREERYDGSISKFGVDIGYQRSGVLVWAVVAPTDHFERGALAGHYGGATAGVSVGVGVGANVLIGGLDHSFALQPLSIEGTTGLNVAGGIGELTLHYHGDRD